jgi:hypothetical protein
LVFGDSTRAICLPIFGLLPIKLLPLTHRTPSGTVRLMTAVKDGQLYWAVFGLCASAIYEGWNAYERMGVAPWWTGAVPTVTLIVMLPAMVLASDGSVFATELLTAPHPAGLRG